MQTIHLLAGVGEPPGPGGCGDGDDDGDGPGGCGDGDDGDGPGGCGDDDGDGAGGVGSGAALDPRLTSTSTTPRVNATAISTMISTVSILCIRANKIFVVWVD